MSTSTEDLTEIERAGRRCAACRSGRHWRQLEVVRPEGAGPVVLCAACRARYGDALPVTESPPPAPARAADPQPTEDPPRSRPQEDRLKKALRELPRGEHSTERIAKASGLNHRKVLGRLHQLEAAGEVQQVGKRWSTERPSSDIEAAMDRLQDRTSNVRIVRESRARA